MEKAKVSNKVASFIKLLPLDFRKQLQIPSDFISTFNGKVPRRFIIESLALKKCWRVEVEEDEDGMFYFRDGWDACTEALCLEVGNTLIFEYGEQSIFQVRIYGNNGCEKNMFVNQKESQPQPATASPPRTVVVDSESDELISFYNVSESEPEPKMSRKTRYDTRKLSMRKDKNGNRTKRKYSKLSNVGDNGTSFSILIAKNHQFHSLKIPVQVVRKTYLASSGEIILRDKKGKCWPVKVRPTTKGANTRVLTGNWKHFLESNNIVIGDEINFKLLSGNLADIHVIRGSQGDDMLQDNISNDVANDQTIKGSIATKEGECDIKCFHNDRLASNSDHCFLQTPHGFKPLEHRVL